MVRKIMRHRHSSGITDGISDGISNGISNGITARVKSGITFGIAFALGIAFCGVANATPTSWTNASGSEADFSYSNGRDDHGLAGSPTTVGDGFQFTPVLLKADSSGGGTTGVLETIHVTITPNSGLRITGITAGITGDYSVLSALQAADSGYQATLAAVKHGGGTPVTNAIAPPDFTTGAAPISDGLTLNIPATMTGPIDLTFNASVHADSNLASAATTELKFLSLGVQTAPTAVPLPAAVATFPLGALVAGWARKRMAK